MIKILKKQLKKNRFHLLLDKKNLLGDVSVCNPNTAATEVVWAGWRLALAAVALLKSVSSRWKRGGFVPTVGLDADLPV